jgi:hypothetical protein
MPGDRERIGGRYLIERPLGRGGMSTVYRVLDEATGRRVALKRMERHADPLRFRREFHTMKSLAHPRIVEVFDFGLAAGIPYYTLELLDGKDLRDLGRVAPAQACELLCDVASALAFLHSRRLLHRDLGPRNVRCTGEGRAKLIDFGILTTMGVTDDLAGTAPYMAPEIANRRPLDQRYDLFGLGALAYRILTGCHAFPSRSIAQLARLERPPPPSSIIAEVPPALDELVLSLLAWDPLARPPSAADVIDRLSAIGGFAHRVDPEITRGWIASGALVGREHEIARIKLAVEAARAGDRKTVLIEAPSGAGKSRLLGELAVEAQLVGTTVVRVNTEASDRGPYGTIHELARGLLATASSDALDCATGRAAMLARVIPELGRHFRVSPARPKGEPNEDRMSLQEELAGWIRDIASLRPIALLVDDVQRCDEASAAVLAALSHQQVNGRLLLAFALRTDENARAPAPMAAISRAGERLRLRGLDEADVARLCSSLFGDVSHLPRLAQWLHRAAGGSPLYTTEVARHLVDRGVIRYADGLWSIPESPGQDDVPEALADAMDARVRALPEPARALGEALSIHGGELPLSLIVAVAESRDEQAVFAALDTLEYEEVLIGAGDARWRFRHDALREALLRGLGPARRQALHLRVGETLLQLRDGESEVDEGDDGARSKTSRALGGVLGRRWRRAHGGAARDAEIGWHLLRGGDPARATVLLERAGRALYDAQSFLDCIPPLEAALENSVTIRGSPRIRLELQRMLVTAGCMADRATALRHAEPCVQGFRYWSGMDVAPRAGRIVGKHLGVVIGLWLALLRWMFSLGRGPNPYAAFRTFFLVVGYSASVHLVMWNERELNRLVELVSPIAILKRRVPYAIYLIALNTLELCRGNMGAVRRNGRVMLDILARDRITPISDIDRRTAIGGGRYMLVLVALSSLDPAWETELDELAKLRLKFFDVGAEQARLVCHRMRGEEDIASEIERRVELLFVQLGSIWQMEAMVALVSSLAYAFARDTLGLRRAIDVLSRLASDGFMVAPYIHLARGEYFRERGDVQAALGELEQVAYRSDLRMLQLPALPALAETLLAAGDHERARTVARDAVVAGSDPDYGNLQAALRSERVLALAEAALGDHESAARRLEDAIARAADRKSPLLSGALHEALARVALAARDSIGFARHAAEAELHFRSSRNPVLVARAERLAENANTLQTTGARQAVSVVAKDAVTMPIARGPSHSAVLAQCRDRSERASTALRLLIDATRAVRGYLFLADANRFAVAAPAWGPAPSDVLGAALADVLDTPERGAIVVRDDRACWTVVPLAMLEPPAPRVIGGVAITADDELPIEAPSPELLRDIARLLYEAGDVILYASA